MKDLHPLPFLTDIKHLPEACQTILFPGCTLTGTRPDTTLKLLNYLKKIYPRLGIVLDCCCKPSHDLGRQTFFHEMFSEMQKYLIDHGIKNVITACPNCYQMFNHYGSPLEVTTEIEKNKRRRQQIKIIRYLFIMISSVLLFCNPVFAVDLRLISVDQFQKSSSEWTILDARSKKAWLSGHISGALSFCWKDYTRTGAEEIHYKTLPPKLLADALGKIGINNQTPIVIYGDTDTSWGGEGWACWALSWLGHQGPVRLLDGGIQMWKKSNFPLKTGEESFTGKTLVYAYQVREDINISATDIQNNPAAFQLVDTRSFFEWIRGGIPGAVHISWKKFYKAKGRRPVTSSEVNALLRENSINPEKPIVYYCTGGIRSGYAWLVHSLAGLPAAINYEGGMAEWEKLIEQ